MRPAEAPQSSEIELFSTEAHNDAGTVIGRHVGTISTRASVEISDEEMEKLCRFREAQSGPGGNIGMLQGIPHHLSILSVSTIVYPNDPEMDTEGLEDLVVVDGQRFQNEDMQELGNAVLRLRECALLMSEATRVPGITHAARSRIQRVAGTPSISLRQAGLDPAALVRDHIDALCKTLREMHVYLIDGTLTHEQLTSSNAGLVNGLALTDDSPEGELTSLAARCALNKTQERLSVDSSSR